MPEVVLTARRWRRWWPWGRVKTWKRSLPEHWEEIPIHRRRRYYSWLLDIGASGLLPVLIDCLHLPRWAVQAIPDRDLKALLERLEWMAPKPDCSMLIFPTFQHSGITYHLPSPKGQNCCCLEFPLADEYFKEYAQDANETTLLLLVATLCRPTDPDEARCLRRDDKRTALYSRSEVIDRANALRGLPIEIQLSVLQYFVGLKKYIHRIYGGWLWDLEDEDGEEEEESSAAPKTQDLYPDFGLWGFYQQVAEAGIFGTLEQVYQASLHDVFMWGVRQQIKTSQQRAQMRSKNYEE